MQDRPICFHCDKPIETNSEMVFEAPCGCVDHSSAVFHALCLFEWRDRRQTVTDRLRKLLSYHREGEEEGEEDGRADGRTS